MSQENSKRKVDDAVHELHVLYMTYFSSDDPWQPRPNRRFERAQLLKRMRAVVNEILTAKKRPSWLHPAMFHGPLRRTICSLPPNPDKNVTLMPLTSNPRDVCWSEFSIRSRRHPLEDKPLVVSLQYHPLYPPGSSQNNYKTSSSFTSGTTSIRPVNDGLTNFTKKNTLHRVGALPNKKFYDEQQIKVEHSVGEILRMHGIPFNRTNNDENEPKEYLYKLPSDKKPISE